MGEHHRPDFAISAPEIVLAAIAGRTYRIKLGTAVTVLSTDHPVRVFSFHERAFQRPRRTDPRARVLYRTVSGFFGHDLQDYDRLFEERLDIFAKLVRDPKVTWSGETRSPLKNQKVFPPLGQPMTVWVGVGGSPESVVRVVRQDLQLMLAIIGGDAMRFAPYVDLYRHGACAQLEKPVRDIGVHSPGFVAETDEKAQEIRAA